MQVKELDKVTINRSLEYTIFKERKILSVNKVTINCIMCGNTITRNEKSMYEYTPRYSKDLCHTCNIWKETVDSDKLSKNVVIINGEHYLIDNSESQIKGFSGRPFKIRFNNGKIVTTNNLWHQGRIPIAWQKYLPDNAQFLIDDIIN